jgi:peptidoglycan/xylan/chitin deacetylase (PgdA/CDA1 family)
MFISDRLVSGFFRYFLPPGLLWKVKTGKKEVFITFDDGPVPGLTDEILDILKAYHARATFFCVGENASRNPGTYQRLLREGHATGNHSQHHLKGWKTPFQEYIQDVEQASEYVDSKLFRPPYGMITYRQARALSQRFRVVMWSVLTRDFDARVTPEQCLSIAVGGVGPGAIIVFHDNIKAREKVLYALPKLLEYLEKEGYRTEVLG